jgi:Virulence-associated protein E
MSHSDLRCISNDTLKSLHPQTKEYRLIVQASASIGSDISMVGCNRSGGDRSQQDDPKDNQDGESPAETLSRVILYLLSSSRIDRDVLLFDCWAGWALVGHKLHTGTGELVCKGKQVRMQTLFNESWNRYRKLFGVGVSNEDSFYSMVLGHLRDSKYNPWCNAIERLSPVSPVEFKKRHGFDPHYMALELVGDNSELIQTLWRYHFTGAILRTMEPGCQHDHMLILISPEKGLGKTSFLKAIARTPDESKHSANNYLQMRSLKNNKADLEKLRGKVIVNLDECDSAFQGLAADDLKEVVTASTDNYRAPYERNAADHPRSAVLFGTTNKVELIQDMDGDRRFFPVRVSKAIDIRWVTDNWADFWGFYKYCYLQSLKDESTYRNWTTKPEEALLVKLQADYKANAPWMETLEGVLDILEDVNEAKLCLLASDLLAVLVKETGATKSYMRDSIKSKLLTERGYQEGKPKCSDGKQPSKPRLFLGKNPKNISRDTIEQAYNKYLSGEYHPKTQQVVTEPMTTIEVGSEFTLYKQLDIFGILELASKAEERSRTHAVMKAKLQAEYPDRDECEIFF